MELTFLPFDKTHYKTIYPYFTTRPTECCESHFIYHVIWKNFYHTKLCILPNGILWLQEVGTYKDAALVPISDKEHLKENFQLLQEHFTQTLKSKLVVFLVDEEALEIISPDPNRYRIVEDINSFDYIYDADKLKSLSGRKYHKKKNHVNAFLREYGTCYEYKQLTALNKDEILEFSRNWFHSKEDDEHNRLESEEIGLNNMLECSSNTSIHMAGIYIHDKLEAFSMATYDDINKMAVIHMEKANTNFHGLYPFISQQFLIHEFPDAIYVNREDDMGNLSLRKAKESYHPIKMGKKYTIYEK